MKKITLKMWTILLSLCVFASVNAADKVFPLGQSDINLISDGGKVAYDGATKTIIYTGAGEIWQFAGYQWSAGNYEDLSAYEYVVVEFDASDLPDLTDPPKIQVQVTYADDTNTQVEVRKQWGNAGVKLDTEKSVAIKEIFVKSQYEGKIVLGTIYATTPKNSDVPFYTLNGRDNGEYNGVTKTLSVSGNWGRISWENINKDVTGYTSLVCEFEIASFEGANWVQLIGEEDGQADIINEVDDMSDGKAQIDITGMTTLKSLHLKLNEAGGSVVLKRIYLEPEDDPTGIAELTNQEDAAVAGYYTIMGVKLPDAPVNGLYIVKYANGKAVKVIKK